MSEDWKHWEGRTVDAKFPLGRYLGGSDRSAVFLTAREDERGGSENAAIKLIPAGADAEEQLERWRAARELEHPNLIRVFETGRAEVDGVGILYVAEESAEENLAQILQERALTAEETRMMLPPALGALQYLHGRGLVHGRIQPSNILAIGEQVKLSSDSVGAPGGLKAAPSAYDPPEAATGADSAASDVWRLGMTLIEVMTQRLPNWDRSKTSAPEIPAALSEPLREIAGRCLQVEPAKRWTIAEIAARLETVQSAGAAASQMQASQMQTTSAGAVVSARENVGGRPLPSPDKAARWPYVVLLAAVVAVILFLMTRAKTPSAADGTGAEGASSSAPHSSAQTGASPTQPESQVATAPDGDNHGVVRRVMPEVSPSARRTIQGTIKIRVRVNVDSAGNVTAAKLESASPSKYFARVALDAARGWKFSPAQANEPGAREWKLQFAFNRAKTEASALRAKR